MSLKNLNNPPLVALAGAGISIGLPLLDAALSSSASLTLLKSLNVAAFATNVIAVSIPGRLDGPQDEAMREGNLNPNKPNAKSPLLPYRTLVNPAGWAFAIWAPIYIGEAAWVATQLFASDEVTSALLPQVTAPFIAANIFQSLWCASFRASYGEGWTKYISAAMLAGTATSLGMVHSAGAALAISNPTILTQLLLPLTMHFGWTSAATLVNLNGSLASDKNASTKSLAALGNSSALAATALGIGLTLSQSSPAYGLTLAWALAACADGLAKRIPSKNDKEEEFLARAAGVQKNLCMAGSLLCAGAAIYAGIM